METKRGRLIVVDGPDASGKGTQVERIYKRLLTAGYASEILDFPQYGKNIFADAFRAYLRGEFGDALKINPHLASVIAAADRWKVKERLEEGLERGTIFIANRYASSNMGHQGAKLVDPRERYDFIEWNREMEYGKRGFGIPVPDLTVLLDVSRESSASMLEARTIQTGGEKDGHEKSTEYQERVAQTFLEIAAGDPSWRVIKCNGPDNKILAPDAITSELWRTIKPFLPLRFEHES